MTDLSEHQLPPCPPVGKTPWEDASDVLALCQALGGWPWDCGWTASFSVPACAMKAEMPRRWLPGFGFGEQFLPGS